MKTEKEIKEKLKWLTPATVGTVEDAIEQGDPVVRGRILSLRWILEND